MKKTEDNLDMKVLKTSTCKTLSGKSTLTYQLGCDPNSKIHLRITKNSGGGFFSDEWIAYGGIQAALTKRLEGQAITSFLLTPLFKGKSANNSSFLLATLKHLKLVQPLKGKQREHEPVDPGPFLDTVEKLMAGAAVGHKKTARKTVRKAPSKKRATSKRKKATTKKASAANVRT